MGAMMTVKKATTKKTAKIPSGCSFQLTVSFAKGKGLREIHSGHYFVTS